MKTKFMILYIDICTYINIIYPMNLSILILHILNK